MDENTTLTTDSFAEMLSGGGENEQPEESDSQNDDDAQEVVEETAQEDGDDAGAQDGADDEAEPEQVEQPEKDSADAFLELEINGEKVQVSKDEAKNGYLRQQDYTQKAQRLAQERQEWNQHVAQQVAEVQQFSQEIAQLTSIDANLDLYKQIDWESARRGSGVLRRTHGRVSSNTRQRGDVE